MMDSQKTRELLQSLNALHTGKHFVYTSGEHGSAYADLRVLKPPEQEENLRMLSVKLLEEVIRRAEINFVLPITVVGPDTLGAIIARLGVEEHNKKWDTQLRWLRLEAYEVDGVKEFRWHANFQPARAGEQVIYVDDLMNAGSTWNKKCRELVEGYGKVYAIGTIADRSGYIAADLHVPYFVSLVRFTLERHKADDCPLCADGVTIVRRPGHGHEFEKKCPSYKGGFIDL